MREPLEVGADTVPAWARGVRLRFDKARKVWMLLVPERVLMPDGVALDIMQKVDGKRSVEAIVDELVDEYAAQRDEMRRDVIEFLQDLATRGYLDR